MQEVASNNEQLIALVETKMPFGKYKGRLIIDLPEPYLFWFRQKGFPDGKIGNLLSLCYEIKLNGLEQMVKSIKYK